MNLILFFNHAKFYKQKADDFSSALSVPRFGFNLPKSNVSKENIITQLISYDESVYSLKDTDWVNEETGEPLGNYKLDPELRDLLKNKIDTSID